MMAAFQLMDWQRIRRGEKPEEAQESRAQIPQIWKAKESCGLPKCGKKIFCKDVGWSEYVKETCLEERSFVRIQSRMGSRLSLYMTLSRVRFLKALL